MGKYDFYNNLIEVFLYLLWGFVWVAGMVLAKGFWSTTIAIVTGGLWSAYLLVEWLLL